MERKRQELISRHFRMYGWFKDFEVEDKKILPDEIDDDIITEQDIEEFYEKNNDDEYASY